MFKRLASALGLALLIVVAVWASLVASYEEDRGTDNTAVLSLRENGSSGASDAIATLGFEDGAEALLWSSLTVEVVVNGTPYACGFGAQSIDTASTAKVQPKLGADGLTFTTVVDATDEETYTYLDLPRQRTGNESTHTMRFSKTDVFLGPNVSWAFVEGGVFEDIKEQGEIDLNNNTEDRLEWYDYDLAVHRVNPKDGVYLFEMDDALYKLQFVSYYNDADESRHPTMRIASLNSEQFPALSDPSLVSPSSCLIVAGDDDLVYWNSTETIQLVEHDVNIVQEGQQIRVNLLYEGQSVRIVENQG